jgi:predicted ATPase
MEQKKLVEQLIKASNEISKNRKSSAIYIHLSEEFIQQQADEREISFDDMVEIIKKELNPNE